MKFFKKKLDILTLTALVIFVMSLNLIDFGDLSWNNNIKGFVGLIAFGILIVFKLYLKFNSKKNLS